MFSRLMICLSLILVACGQQTSSTASVDMMPEPEAASDHVLGGAEQSMTEFSEPRAKQSAPQAKKYIALRHHITVEMAAESMQSGFDAALKHCESLNCQIVRADYNKATQYNPPHAALHVRLPPRNVEIFLGGLAKSGEILHHSRNAEDKTRQVVDLEARIKNTTDMRNRLREMLNNKSAKFRDIIEVQRALSNTQSQLDSMMSQRKYLSLETDFVAVTIDFSAKQGVTEHGFFSPVAQALQNAGHLMMESLATLIRFIASVLPWLMIGIPLMLLSRKLLRKYRNRFSKQ